MAKVSAAHGMRARGSRRWCGARLGLPNISRGPPLPPRRYGKRFASVSEAACVQMLAVLAQRSRG
jgi:hypothetical protein